jgi:Bardet-Biedl syndrome 2 protein
MNIYLLDLRLICLSTVGLAAKLTNLDVENNRDVFDKEVADGVNCIFFGRVRGIMEPLVLVGGDCSITGFNLNGEEKFWTVTGDNVQALEMVNWSSDSTMDLVAGSDDFSIRVYKGEELIFDINESAKITALSRIKSNVFGFALANGTFGVYYTRKLLWKHKKQAKVTSIVGMDFTVEGEM